MRQLLLELSPPAPPSFDNFIAAANSAVLDVLQQWLQTPAQSGKNTAFHLCGERGAGKSHLLHAAVALGFSYYNAKEHPALNELDVQDGQYQPGVALAIDHLEALDAAGEATLFRCFNHVHHAGGKLLSASVQPPLSLAMREDLRTRLGSGVVCRLRPISDEDKRAALQQQCAARRMKLPPEALDYLFNHAARDMRTLSTLIDTLDRYSLETKRTLTLTLLRGVLNESMQPTQPLQSKLNTGESPSA